MPRTPRLHRRLQTLAPTLATVVALAGLSACGSDDESESEQEREQEFASQAAEAADQSVCSEEAEAIAAPYDGFPTAWTFPEATTVYDVEDRGTTGVIVTAVSTTPFEDVLDFLNEDEAETDYEITGGETEDDDAEANWVSSEFSGRWAIRKSDTCPGETVIQVLATPLG